MRTVWRIFTRDIMRIVRNPVALVVTIGVAIIPSLYAWFNILANWDPYSATGNLQVAVANEDRGTDSDLTGHLDAGSEVVAKLKENDSLGWRFVDEDAAVEGVKSGEYYAAIVLPRDFSASLVESVTDGGRQPSLKYYVNEKKNAIAPKITDTGATTIDEQINSQFVQTVSRAVADAIADTGGKLGDTTTTASGEIVTDLNRVLDGIADVRASLADMQDSLSSTIDLTADAKRNLATASTQIDTAQRSLEQTSPLLAEARKSSGEFASSAADAMDKGAVGLAGFGVDVNTAAGTLINGFTGAQESVESIAGKADTALDAVDSTLDTVRDALRDAGYGEDSTDETVKQVWASLDALDALVAGQKSAVDGFRTHGTQFASSGKDAASALASAATTATNTGVDTLTTMRGTLTGTVMPSLDSGLGSFQTLTSTLGGTLASLKGTVAQATSLLDQLADTAKQASDTIGKTDTSLGTLHEEITGVRDDVGAIDSSAAYQRIADALDLDAEGIGEFMGSPVQLSTKTVYPVENYGSAVTPFYTNLALWVGGFVLIAIYKLEVDRDGLEGLHVSAAHAYMGRWLLLVVIGVLQAVIATVGDLALGIQCDHPVLFVLAGILCSFTYINIIYSLGVAFRHIGKALAVVLVIIQIPGASGLYPIELMPDFFRRIHPWLPFTYGINAMRGTIAGIYGDHYTSNMLSLCWYVPVALFVGLIVRRYAMNLNALFDRRLGDTDLMITEHHSMVDERVSLSALLRDLGDSDDLRSVVTRRAHRYFARYPRLVRAGLAALLVLPFVFLVLLFVIQSKIAMLTAWIASIVLIDAYLIVVEFVRDSYARQIGVSAMTADEFRAAMLHGGVMTTARRPHPQHKAGATPPTASDGDAGTPTAMPPSFPPAATTTATDTIEGDER
ncbi:YhgE/Pip domain-containing protein [Bifidobacterium samirii]|uniref:ABC transporter n=1 Tax=Bifidobacterium samirii TaxID=2306974 RepID=A0A430FV17_9BIFI|nr:YhgE/Pip domain-containing protein [Bifidobacterium samirii]RSX57399.1 ABC transporter [Bifidobacterium samirii]